MVQPYGQRNSARNKPLERLNKELHSVGPGSAMDSVFNAMRDQRTTYDPRLGTGQSILNRRHPGRSTVPYSAMQEFPVRLPKTRAFAFPGSGKAYVPADIRPLGRVNRAVLGRAGLANHEFEHAFNQQGGANRMTGTEEIAPMIGDMVFGAENFRRQEGKELRAPINIGGKVSDIGWMRSMAQKHGYFDGRSMTDLLNTPAGRSYLKQAANMKGGVPDMSPAALYAKPLPTTGLDPVDAQPRDMPAIRHDVIRVTDAVPVGPVRTDSLARVTDPVPAGPTVVLEQTPVVSSTARNATRAMLGASPNVSLSNPGNVDRVTKDVDMFQPTRSNSGYEQRIRKRPVAVDGFGDPRVPGAPLKGAPAMDPLRPFGNTASVPPGESAPLVKRAVPNVFPTPPRSAPGRANPMVSQEAASVAREVEGARALGNIVAGMSMDTQPNQEYESSVARTAALRAQAAELLQGRGRGGNADLYDSSNPFNMGNAAGPRSPGVNEDFQASMNRREGRVGMSTNRQRAAQMPGGMPDLPAGFQYADQRERASQPRAAANMYMSMNPAVTAGGVREESIGENVPSDIRASLEAGQPLNKDQRARLRAVGAERRERLRSNTAFQDYRDRLRQRREDAVRDKSEANALRGGQRQTGALTYVDRGTGFTGAQPIFSGPEMGFAEAAGRVRQRREDQRRQDEADEMAQGQQRFNQQLQLIQQMPEGPEKNAMLTRMAQQTGIGESDKEDTQPGDMSPKERAELRASQDRGFETNMENGELDRVMDDVVRGLPGWDGTPAEYMEDVVGIRPDQVMEYYRRREGTMTREKKRKLLDLAESMGADTSNERSRLQGSRDPDVGMPDDPNRYVPTAPRGMQGLPPSMPFVPMTQ